MLGPSTYISKQDRRSHYVNVNELNKDSLGRQAARSTGDNCLEISAGAKTFSLVF